MLVLRSLFHLCIKKYIFLFSGYIIREDEVRRKRQIMHTTFRAESGWLAVGINSNEKNVYI